MRVNGLMIKPVVLVYILMAMELNILESGLRISKMVKEGKSGRMGRFMRGNIRMEPKMEKDC